MVVDVHHVIGHRAQCLPDWPRAMIGDANPPISTPEMHNPHAQQNKLDNVLATLKFLTSPVTVPRKSVALLGSAGRPIRNRGPTRRDGVNLGQYEEGNLGSFFRSGGAVFLGTLRRFVMGRRL